MEVVMTELLSLDGITRIGPDCLVGEEEEEEGGPIGLRVTEGDSAKKHHYLF